MRWLPIFLSLALPFGSSAAKKSASVGRFEEYHTKAVSSYAPAKLDDKAYKQLTTAPRDYTAAVLLTAMGSRFGCQLCREFQPEWDLLAKSWTKGDKKGESRLVFGTLDFADGRDTFVSVRDLYAYNVRGVKLLTMISSLVYKLLQFCCFSSLLLDRMPSMLLSPCDTISPMGKINNRFVIHSYANRSKTSSCRTGPSLDRPSS